MFLFLSMVCQNAYSWQGPIFLKCCYHFLSSKKMSRSKLVPLTVSRGVTHTVPNINFVCCKAGVPLLYPFLFKLNVNGKENPIFTSWSWHNCESHKHRANSCLLWNWNLIHLRIWETRIGFCPSVVRLNATATLT